MVELVLAFEDAMVAALMGTVAAPVPFVRESLLADVDAHGLAPFFLPGRGGTSPRLCGCLGRLLT
jgi:hypothetical protein